MSVLDKTSVMVSANPHIFGDFVPSLRFSFSGGTGKQTILYNFVDLRREVYVDMFGFDMDNSLSVENFKLYHIDSSGRSLCVFSSDTLRGLSGTHFDLGFWALRPTDRLVVEYEGSEEFAFSLTFKGVYTEKSFYNVHTLERIVGKKSFFVRDFDSLGVRGGFSLEDGFDDSLLFSKYSINELEFKEVYERSCFIPVRSIDITPKSECLVHTQRSVFNRNNVLTMLSVMRNLRRDIMYSEKENFMNEVYRHVLGRGIKFSDVNDIIDNYELFLKNTPHLGVFDSYAVPEVSNLIE